MSFSVQKLATFSSNPSKVYFEGLAHFFIYVRDNITLGLKYYSDMKDASLSDLLRQANIKTENQLMVLSDSSCQYCPDIGINTGAHIIFYQGGPIDHGTHVPRPLSQSNA